jgi:hypothetical protein
MRSLCDNFMTNHWRWIATLERPKGAYVMGFTDQRDTSLDEIDYVSAWILRLAAGMMVLGLVFAVLDRFELLPQPLPEPSQLPHVTTNQAAL